MTVPFFDPPAMDRLLAVTVGRFRERATVVQIVTGPPYGTVGAVTLDLDDARRLRDELTAALEAAA